MNQSTPLQDAGAATGSYRSYATGLVMAIILTAVSFALIAKGRGWPPWALYCSLSGAAILQILVHLHYFLHLDRSSAARWNVMALLLTVLIMILFVGGTLWIMYDLNARMM